MKTKPCKHPKSERYHHGVFLRCKYLVNSQNGDIKKLSVNPNEIDTINTYCAYCGKKIREVEVEQ